MSRAIFATFKIQPVADSQGWNFGIVFLILLRLLSIALSTSNPPRKHGHRLSGISHTQIEEPSDATPGCGCVALVTDALSSVLPPSQVTALLRTQYIDPPQTTQTTQTFLSGKKAAGRHVVPTSAMQRVRAAFGVPRRRRAAAPSAPRFTAWRFCENMTFRAPANHPKPPFFSGKKAAGRHIPPATAMQRVLAGFGVPRRRRAAAPSALRGHIASP
ncbi:hypothetical protein B0H15DRAFT_945190 [Mycena belliarum]|uniref:Uncharacterized protein n=1 Tax=Mycena belliarum TaxID=1033014 RepID=A0AAD6UDT8_9AGAR|nr:hypothetical protein B0H15DRAFT_945189 [Mycena belliae]KAJ7098681.1 hypothetical protein B0H15DRAFT_945190 [Mycena belliae]